MQLIKSKNFDKFDKGPVVVAIGSFDGLHIGHKKIINKTIKLAKKNNIKSGVYSFSPHPLEVVAPERAPSFLISASQKTDILKKLGVDYFFEQEFTNEFSNLRFENFVRDILIKKLNISHIIVGNDFKFGKDQFGDTDKLKEISKKYNISVHALEVLKESNSKISSTYIRKLIREGDVAEVSKYLGRNYILEGKVITGEGRGKKLGIPTANIKLDTDYVLPPKGVYACYAHYNNKKYDAIVNFGKKPTFANKKYSIEVHIFDMAKDIYGSKLKVELIDFVREEKSFSSEEELVSQIKDDILYTRNLLC